MKTGKRGGRGAAGDATIGALAGGGIGGQYRCHCAGALYDRNKKAQGTVADAATNDALASGDQGSGFVPDTG
jgi:hypothetical protein